MQDINKKFETLKKQLLKFDGICIGTINTIYTKCGSIKCDCYMNKKSMHGPYYTLTFKKNGKTVSKGLSKKQVPLCRKYIKNYKKFKKIVESMKELSLSFVLNI